VNKSEVLKKLKLSKKEMKEFSVKDLYLFGSYAREEAGDQSDLDILVEFEPEAQIGLFGLANFWVERWIWLLGMRYAQR
jgi:predicted nucleotidyltransferase